MSYKDFTIEEGTSSDINTYLMRQMMIVCTSSTRPLSPQSGMRVWETDTLKEMVYNGSSWLLLAENPIYVQKTTDETISNSATMQDDNELFASVAANTDYVVTLSVLMNGVSGFPDDDTWDAKVTFSGPASSTFGWSTQGTHPSAGVSTTGPISVNYLGNMTDVADVRTMGAFTSRLILRGLLRVSGTSGTFRFRWCQSVAVPGSSTRVIGTFAGIYLGSYMLLERVA